MDFSTSVLMLIALGVPGVLLAIRIKRYVQTVPGKLYSWIIASIMVFGYKVLICTIILVSYDALSTITNYIDEAICEFFNYNLVEILPVVILKSAVRVTNDPTKRKTTRALSSYDEIRDIFGFNREIVLSETVSA